MDQGFFIALEGLDYAGKTVLTGWLLRYFTALGMPVRTVRAPGGTEAGKRLRNILVDDPAPFGDLYARQQVFLADHRELLTQAIMPAIERGEVVIADRFLDSTFAYAVGGLGLDPDLLEDLIYAQVESAMPFAEPLPHLSLYMDIPVDTLIRRREADPARDPLDNKPADYYEGVRRAYYTLLARGETHRRAIDATGDLESVRQLALSVVGEYLDLPEYPAVIAEPEAVDVLG